MTLIISYLQPCNLLYYVAYYRAYVKYNVLLETPETPETSISSCVSNFRSAYPAVSLSLSLSISYENEVSLIIYEDYSLYNKDRRIPLITTHHGLSSTNLQDSQRNICDICCGYRRTGHFQSYWFLKGFWVGSKFNINGFCGISQQQ